MTSSPGSMLSPHSRFAEAARLWLDQYRGDAENGIYSLTSVDTYSGLLRNHVLPALGNLRLVEVKAPVINSLCQGKLKAYSLTTAKHTKAVVSNVMTFAMQAGTIPSNPAREIAPLSERRAKTKRKKARALTADELLDFLAKLDQDEEARQRDLPDLVRFFIAAGGRRGEALGAHWSDFDENSKVLTMTGNLVHVRGRAQSATAGSRRRPAARFRCLTGASRC